MQREAGLAGNRRPLRAMNPRAAESGQDSTRLPRPGQPASLLPLARSPGIYGSRV